MKLLSEQMRQKIMKGTAEDYMTIGEWADEVAQLEAELEALIKENKMFTLYLKNYKAAHTKAQMEVARLCKQIEGE